MSQSPETRRRPGDHPRRGRRMALELGAPIDCRDGELGVLADVILDPGSRCVTHIVVEAHHHRFASPRLVPVMVAQPREHEGHEAGRQAGLTLQCTLTEFGRMDAIREFARGPLDMPGSDDQWDVGKLDVVGPAVPAPLDAGAASYVADPAIVYDRVPKHEIELGRTSEVRSSDGHHLGHVAALAVDGAELTALMVERRHWWAHKRVEVPVDAVGEIRTDLVTLKVNRRAARRLMAAQASVGRQSSLSAGRRSSDSST